MPKFNSLEAVNAYRALTAARELHSELIEFRSENGSTPILARQIQDEQNKISGAIRVLRADRT
jgi:hypothetical protein